MGTECEEFESLAPLRVYAHAVSSCVGDSMERLSTEFN